MQNRILLKNLFHEQNFEQNFEDIQTEGIKYTGSKNKIISHILNMVYPLGVRTILDGFSGTTRVSTRVSQGFAKMGCRVISNDIADWSQTLALCYLRNKKNKKYYQNMIEHLNELPGRYGWFSENYGGNPQKKGIKRPWQLHNTMKLDAIREEIDQLTEDPIERSVLLTSLLLALDKVDSTLGHYSSYLKEWASRSYKTMQLKTPSLIPNETEHEVYQKDIFHLLPKNRSRFNLL